MKTNSQLNFVRRHLESEGSISRNYALEHYLSRLASRIEDLKHEGYIIEGKTVKTPRGKDYQYKLISRPAPKTLSFS